MNKQLADDQTHVVNHDLGQNLHWMHVQEKEQHVNRICWQRPAWQFHGQGMGGGDF